MQKDSKMILIGGLILAVIIVGVVVFVGQVHVVVSESVYAVGTVGSACIDLIAHLL